MMIKTIFFFSIIIFSYVVRGQSVVYTYKYSSVNDDYFSKIIKNKDGNYEVFLNQIQWSSQTNGAAKSSVIFIDSLGKFKKKINLSGFSDSISVDYVSEINDNYYVFGGRNKDVYIQVFDSCYNLIRSKRLRIASNIIYSPYINDVVHLDSSLFLIIQFRTPSVTSRIAVLKVNDFTLDSLNIFLSSGGGIAHCGIQHVSGNGIYVFTSYYNNCGYGQMLSFDKELNILSCDTIPKLFHIGLNALWHNDSTLILSGISVYDPDPYYNLYDKDIGILEMDISAKYIKSRYFFYKGDQDYVGFGTNLIKTRNAYYITGVHNRNYGPIVTPSDVFLAKVDSNLNVLWSRVLTDSTANYDVSGIIETNDGGVLMLVWKTKMVNSLLDRDAYIFRVSKNGVLVSINKIPINKVDVSLYPIPAKEVVSLSLSENKQLIQSYRIFDITGKQVVFKQVRTKQINIAVGQLAVGVYILEGQTTSGAVFRRKFIKN